MIVGHLIFTQQPPNADESFIGLGCLRIGKGILRVVTTGQKKKHGRDDKFVGVSWYVSRWVEDGWKGSL